MILAANGSLYAVVVEVFGLWKICSAALRSRLCMRFARVGFWCRSLVNLPATNPKDMDPI